MKTLPIKIRGLARHQLRVLVSVEKVEDEEIMEAKHLA
jgi:hypothetical protein